MAKPDLHTSAYFRPGIKQMTLTVIPNVENLPQRVPLRQALSIPTGVLASYQTQSVGVLGLSVRPTNCLTKLNILSLGQLVSLTVTELFDIPAMGYTSVREIVRRVTEFFGVCETGLPPKVHLSPGQICELRRATSKYFPLTFRDEWEHFSWRAAGRLPLALLPVPPEIAAKLFLSLDGELDALLDWSWDELCEQLGQEAAEELLQALITLAQEHRSTLSLTPPSDFESRRHILEARWADCSISQCGLQPQTRRLLRTQKIQTLRQLMEAFYPLTKALAYDLPAFKDVWESLVALDMRQGDAQAEWESLLAVPECEACLDDVVADMKAVCSERSWTVLCLRFGIEMADEETEGIGDDARERTCYTLEDIAQKIDRTRERVRQIELRGIEKLQQFEVTSWQSLTATLAFLMQQAGGVLAVADAAAEIGSRFPAASVNAEGLCHLLFELSSHFAPVQRGSIYRVTSLPANAYEVITDQAAEIAKRSLVNLSEEELGCKVQESLESEGHAYDLRLISACLRADGRFSSDMTRRDLNFLILETLRSIGKPAHYSEITEKLNASGWRHYPTSEKSLHSRLVSKRDLFVYMERGVYGLVEWGLEDKRFFDRYRNGFIGDIIEEFLAARDAPADAAEIITFVLSRKRCQDYSVRQCLSRDERFHVFGRGRYGLKRWVM